MRALTCTILSFLIGTQATTAWELLTLRDGTTAEGDLIQEQFVLREASGSEVVVPRAAILELSHVAVDGTPMPGGAVEARIKDGTRVSGVLTAPVEIQDGMVSRRYSPEDVASIQFDRFVDLDQRKEFTTCPIRFQIDAGSTLLGDATVVTNLKTSRVKCDEVAIRSMRLDRKGKFRPNKPLSVAAAFQIWVPKGDDLWSDLSLQLVQADKVLARRSLRTALDEGELNNLNLALEIGAGKFDPAGPPALFQVQLVNQKSKQVEKGTYFWWFTFPLPW